MADEGLRALAQAKGVLEVAAASQERRREIEWQRDWLRHVTTRPAYYLLAASGDAHDGVVAAHVDVTIMCQHAPGDRCQPLPGVVVLICDGFIAQVAAGHHQYCWLGRLNMLSESVQQHVMQRCVWQHYSQSVIGWCDAWCHRTIRALGEEHDGTPVRLEQRCLGIVHLAEPASCLEIGDHERERFGLAVLALAQALHCLCV